MDNQKEQQVKDYIQKKEKTEGISELAKTVSDLAGLETETKEGFFSGWLKNDKNLLTYAQLLDKKDFLNIGENIQFKLLEVKLSITCPYFADFKDFLTEIKLGPDTSKTSETDPNKKSSKSQAESIETGKSKFRGTDVKDIKSEPFGKNRKTGTTRCSKTARDNGLNFGLNLPNGNAYDAGKDPGKDSIQTIPENKKNKKPQKSREGINFTTFTGIKEGNYADIYTDSKSNYGHRAAAFKDDNGKRYVLDPYTRINGKLDDTPKELDEYLKGKKIVKAHIYNSTGYKEKA